MGRVAGDKVDQQVEVGRRRVRRRAEGAPHPAEDPERAVIGVQRLRRTARSDLRPSEVKQHPPLRRAAGMARAQGPQRSLVAFHGGVGMTGGQLHVAEVGLHPGGELGLLHPDAAGAGQRRAGLVEGRTCIAPTPQRQLGRAFHLKRLGVLQRQPQLGGDLCARQGL